MSLQSTALAMAALGIEGDEPPNALQPRLVDGVHLRWSTPRRRGFPWYGFYLFRREHLGKGGASCFASALAQQSVGNSQSASLQSGAATLSASGNLRYSDDFAPQGQAELDLDEPGGATLELRQATWARRVELTIGLRSDAGIGPPTCAPFDSHKAGTQANPLEVLGASFETFEAGAIPSKHTEIVAIQTTGGSRRGLDCGRRLDVSLPGPADDVNIVLTYAGEPARVAAFDADGRLVARAVAGGTPHHVEQVRLQGARIEHVVITATGQTVIHELCWRGRSGAGRPAIEVVAYDGDVPVASTALAGQAGQTVSGALEADRISRVEIGAGDAAIVDLCWYSVETAAADGWEPLGNCPQPIALPARNPHYPADRGTVNESQSRTEALGRVRYGPAGQWGGARFTSLHKELQRLVQGGPNGPAMESIKSSVQGTAQNPDPGAPAPRMPDQHPLDLVLLASLNPAMAQILGLYWVDTTAAPGIHYDYLVVADHSGAGRGKASAVLGEIHAHGFRNVDGWICFDVAVEEAVPLEAPTGTRSYSLPGGYVQQGGGTGVDRSYAAGLRWQGEAGAGPAPGRPVLFNVWRADRGDGESPGGFGTYAVQTKSPVLLGTMSATGAGTSGDDWPPFELQFVDTGMAEGWYSYAVSGIDIFGRHTLTSAPAPWWQWAPEPDPVPWYYVEPGGARQLNGSAVQVLDKLPPPPPAGVEAYALDPDDPLIVQDPAYTAWRQSSPGVFGLRVRWRWTESQMTQAPDAKEFRIYVNDGTVAPSPPEEPTSWSTRVYVVQYDDNWTQDADPRGGATYRQYDLFLPLPGDSGWVELPSVPSRSAPINYAHVSVSAADDKQHTADDPKWDGTPWGDRTGNESLLGATATVYRVLRTPPDPPPVPQPDAGDIFATPADYHGKSYYTYRWSPGAALRTHIFRALDDSVFATDWNARVYGTSKQVTAAQVEAIDSRFDPTTAQAIADDINNLDTFAHDDAGRAGAMDYYRTLGNDRLRVLAGLAQTADAFHQLTIQPLDPGDADNADRRGPDDPADYTPDQSLRAYVDAIDGRSQNVWFYRCAYVDSAGNRSDLSLSSPPIHMPNVVPPMTPTVTKMLGGDRSISISWASNREPDLDSYRVYRAEDAAGAADLRLMTLVHEEAVAAGKPDTRPGEVSWQDTVPGLTTFYYRLAAVDSAGNVSEPTDAMAGRGYDLTPPPAPDWQRSEWVLLDAAGHEHPYASGAPAGETWSPAVSLAWSTAEPSRTLVQRSPEGAESWQSASGWLDPAEYDAASGTWTYSLHDTAADPTQPFDYRIKVQSAAGNLGSDFDERTVGVP